MTTATKEAPTLADRYHAEGCPSERVEQYEARKPARPDQGEAAKKLTVTRCIDCGGAHVKEA